MLHVKRMCFVLFLKGFKRPVRLPLWRNQSALALSVPVTREKDVFFSVSRGFQTLCQAPAVAESALCYTHEKDVFFSVSGGFQTPCYAPAVAEAARAGAYGVCYT